MMKLYTISFLCSYQIPIMKILLFVIKINIRRNTVMSIEAKNK